MNRIFFFSMPWDGNEGKRMAGVPHSEKSAGFHSPGLPIKNNSSNSCNSWLKIISLMNPLFLLNHREAVCFLRQVPAERLSGLS